VAADGFRFTNEIRLDAKEEFIYIVETCGRHISRMRVAPDGSLSRREIFGPNDLGPGGTPDGIAFDSFGNLWGTIVFGERLFAITPDGDLRILFDDGDPEAIAEFDRNFFAGTVEPKHMAACKSKVAPWLASVTFGGRDLKTVYIGCLMGTNIPYFRSPVAGLPMIHW
jgi:hypothetical protein